MNPAAPTVKLLAIYDRPDDVEAFLAHYHQTHTPLVAQLPGLLKLVVSRVEKTLMGRKGAFLIAEMHFADRPAFDAAMASEQNRAAGKDLMSFAGNLATLMVVEEQPEAVAPVAAR